MTRHAGKDKITDENCREAIRKAEDGLIYADLGKGLIKQAIPRGNLGAARGARVVVFYRRGKVAVFLHIFPKNKKANLSDTELAMYSRAAEVYAKFTDKELSAAAAKAGWRELEL
jgi:hypothetical protein